MEKSQRVSRGFRGECGESGELPFACEAADAAAQPQP